MNPNNNSYLTNQLINQLTRSGPLEGRTFVDIRAGIKMPDELRGTLNKRHVNNSSQRKKGFSLTHLATFLILFSLWLILSGKFDLFHLSLGLISCGIVTCISADLPVS